MRGWILSAFVAVCSGCRTAETRLATTYHPDRAGDRVEVSVTITFPYSNAIGAVDRESAD